MLGLQADVRVLEPSPPGIAEPPWFADDPTEGRALDWSAEHDVDPEWRRQRWLGPFGRLAELPRGYLQTRLALHELAAGTISPAREAVNGKIGLRWTLGGFGTPFFGADRQLRVEHAMLVRQEGERATREPLGRGVEREAAAAIGEWFGFGTSVLEALRARHPGLEPSRVQLWPEHFDVSLELGIGAVRATYGGSPGDEGHYEPYLYVAPWGETPRGERWRARGFSGAELPYALLLEASSQRGLAIEFFEACMRDLRAV